MRSGQQQQNGYAADCRLRNKRGARFRSEKRISVIFFNNFSRGLTVCECAQRNLGVFTKPSEFGGNCGKKERKIVAFFCRISGFHMRPLHPAAAAAATNVAWDGVGFFCLDRRFEHPTRL